MSSSSSSKDSNKDNVFDLGSSAFASDHFRMHEFKVKRCPRARPHDWTQCPFAHPGEKARRRDPRRYRYSGTACPEFRKSGCCRRGDACPFAHGVFECWLHPSRYRTQLCTDGGSCKRRVCFFAHCESELRRPEDDPVTAERQVQAELAAEVQVLQQQHLAQALQTIFDASGVGNGNGSIDASHQPPGVALELLKQLTAPQAGPVMATPDASGAGNSTNALLALLQQLGNVQAQHAAQQQQPGKQQQEIVVSEPLPAMSKPMQDTGSVPAVGQESLHVALKQVFEQQRQHQQHAAPPAGSAIASSSTAFPGAHPAASPMSGGAPNGLHLDSSQLLQLDPNVLNTLLQQTTAARARAPATSGRHSIDNSFLAAKILGMSGQMESEDVGQSMLPIQSSQAPVSVSQSIQNGQTPSHGHPDARQMMAIGNGLQPGHYMNGDVGHGHQQQQMQMPVTVHGVPLEQNPALSSHLLQLDPALLNSLAMRARQAGSVGGAPSRMVDNGFLTRMSNVDVSGIVNGVAAQPDATGNPMVASGVPVQHTNDLNGFLQNGALASQFQALLQGLSLEGMKAEGPQPQVQYNAMPSYEKGAHHERVGSGAEGSVLMPSNMLQQ